MALLAAVTATALLTALGLAIALLGMGESILAGHERTARALRHASHAGVQLAAADLRVLPTWSAALAAGGVPQVSGSEGRFMDASLTPAAPWGGTIDLRGMTDDIQASSDAFSRGDAQVWRLFECGPLERGVPGMQAGPWYVAVWVADDRADSDGDPLIDTNGVLALRAVAIGPDGALAATDVSVMRATGPGGVVQVRILTIRPG